MASSDTANKKYEDEDRDAKKNILFAEKCAQDEYQGSNKLY